MRADGQHEEQVDDERNNGAYVFHELWSVIRNALLNSSKML
jgi:hypothetical protein